MAIEHKEWKSIYMELPEDGSNCVSGRSGEDGYVGDCWYDAMTNTFRTYEDCRNRLIITVWKHDLWYYK